MSSFKIQNTINQRYQILSVLGQGGMATVYKALDTKSEQFIALKALNFDQLQVARRTERFLREFQILSELKHPNIVQVFEQSEAESGEPFFTMECLDGMALSELIKKIFTDKSENLEIEDAILILEQIANALDYIHTQKIVYCDLKPANILVLNSSIDTKHKYSALKLLDFGISKFVDQQNSEEPANMLGTSYYMSPEQIRSEVLDQRSDIYSFGVLAFELLTGNVPFNHEALFSVTASHLIGKVPSIRDLKRQIPSSIDRMIQICMEKNKEHRYSSMQEIFNRLEVAKKQSGKKVTFFQRIFNRS